ncbi:MAG TPA: hypothetical protein PK765_06545 [bacterium]|nr:hypothetical protein [bacterium]
MLLHKAWKKAGVTLSFSLRNNEINLYAIFNAVKTAAENGVLFSGDCDTNIADCLSKFGPLASWQQMNKSNHYNDPVDDPDPSRTLEQISALEKFQEVFSPRKTLLVANSVESV